MKRYILIALIFICMPVSSVLAAKPELKFRNDGTFKVVAFSDIQDDEDMDPQTFVIMGRVLDLEKPDFVVIVGDCISGSECESVENVKKAISWVSVPMEQRNIPWAIVFGNHDQEHNIAQMSKQVVLREYAKYPHNLNDKWAKGISGAGNNNLLVKKSSSNKAGFAIWLIDSGMYAPASIGGYDWIHADQIEWYSKTSQSMEKKYGEKIPGLMFMHIPLVEVADMYAKGKVLGVCYEPVSCSKVNSGMFSAVLDRGDVKGIFAGHDHINNFVGEWMGVKLGFDASAGAASYGLPADNKDKDRVKGGRVFLIKESDPWNFTTWMRFRDDTTEPADIKADR